MTAIRNIIWAVMVGGAFGVSIGTLIVVHRLQRRLSRCEDLQSYIASREAARLISDWLRSDGGMVTGSSQAGDGLSTGSSRAPDGPFPGDGGLPPDDDGPSTGS